MEDILNKIKQEVERQDNIWGKNRNLDDRTWITVLLEEVGEVARASLEHDKENLEVELVQVAAVCVAFYRNMQSKGDIWE